MVAVCQMKETQSRPKIKNFRLLPPRIGNSSSPSSHHKNSRWQYLGNDLWEIRWCQKIQIFKCSSYLNLNVWIIVLIRIYGYISGTKRSTVYQWVSKQPDLLGLFRFSKHIIFELLEFLCISCCISNKNSYQRSAGVKMTIFLLGKEHTKDAKD